MRVYCKCCGDIFDSEDIEEGTKTFVPYGEESAYMCSEDKCPSCGEESCVSQLQTEIYCNHGKHTICTEDFEEYYGDQESLCQNCDYLNNCAGRELFLKEKEEKEEEKTIRDDILREIVWRYKKQNFGY